VRRQTSSGQRTADRAMVGPPVIARGDSTRPVKLPGSVTDSRALRKNLGAAIGVDVVIGLPAVAGAASNVHSDALRAPVTHLQNAVEYHVRALARGSPVTTVAGRPASIRLQLRM